MNYSDFEIQSTEDFEIILDSSTHSISSAELITILENSRQLIKGINVTLNKKYCAGFDIIDFDVVAFEPGSFKIPIKINKFSNAAGANAVGGIIAGLFMLGVQNIPISVSSEEINVNKDDLMEYHDTKTAVVNIAKMTVQSDSITGLSMNYIKEDGAYENVRIEKTTLEPIASIDTDILPEIKNHTSTLRLIVIAPVLDDKKVQWKFRTLSGNIISAKMNDELFLAKLEKEHIAFGKGDVLFVEMETKITVTEEGQQKPSYSITKVIDYPKYLKNGVPKQESLDL